MSNHLDSTRDLSLNKPHSHVSDKQFTDRSHLNRNFRFDDLIVSLANAHENRRARQVTEWERMRRQSFPAAV